MRKNIRISLFLLGSLLSQGVYCSLTADVPFDLPEIDSAAEATTKDTLMGSVQNVSVPSEDIDIDSDVDDDSENKSDNESFTPKFHKDLESKEPNTLYQPTTGDNDEVYLNFEDADLSSVASYMEKIHNVTFITDDAIQAASSNSTSSSSSSSSNSSTTGLQGHKVSFRMFKSVSKRQSWNLFTTFLKMAGLDLVPMPQPGFYKIVSFTTSSNEALPTYIGVDPELLPDNDMMIRYVYFLQNSDVTTVQPLISQLQGSVGKLETYTDLKALIFIDKAYNVRSLMNIVIELDKADNPQVVSVIKLKHSLADDVITLYNSLKPTETAAERAWAPVKKESSLQYFPSDVILVSDKRTNSLIVLGTEKSVTRIENFIRNHVDDEIAYRDSPVHTYRLEYTNATDVKSILSDVVSYGSGTNMATYGGTLYGEKYFSPMTIVADTNTNSLIINSTKSDYAAIKKLIQEIDVPQKQIAFDFLLLQVSNVDKRTLGMQIAGSTTTTDDGTKGTESTFLNSLSAQTSGVPSGTSVVYGSDNSIKTSLASLITGNLVNTAGSTLVTFGKSIWGLLKIVKQIGSTTILANPFVVTTNNTEGSVVMGVTRRVKTSDVITTSSSSSSNVTASGYEDSSADLTIKVTPQVNEDNIINLSLYINNSDFTVTNDPTDPTQNQKVITTTASLAAGEVLVVGGIVTENISTVSTGVPFLEKIPLLGWMFKSKQKSVNKDHFVVFISPRIIDPLGDDTDSDMYTEKKIQEAHDYLDLMDDLELGDVVKDPITKNFFGGMKNTNIHLFQEDVDAYEKSKSDRDALLKSIKQEPKTRKERREQNLKNRKKRRKKRKNKSRFARKIKKKRRKKQKLVKDTKDSPLIVQEDFLENAFPLNNDTFKNHSLYEAVYSEEEGVQNV